MVWFILIVVLIPPVVIIIVMVPTVLRILVFWCHRSTILAIFSFPKVCVRRREMILYVTKGMYAESTGGEPCSSLQCVNGGRIIGKYVRFVAKGEACTGDTRPEGRYASTDGKGL